MVTRRSFFFVLTTLGVFTSVGAPSFAGDATALGATAITRVYGNGLRFVAVAVAFSGDVAADRISVDDFKITGRTITDVYPSTSGDPGDRAETGRFVIVELSDADANAMLAVQPEQKGPPAGTRQDGGMPRWKAGDCPSSNDLEQSV